MSILPHTVFGAVIGSFFTSPVLAGTAGFFSHYVLDAIPHFDPDMRGIVKYSQLELLGIKAVVFVDIGLSLLLLIFFYQFPSLFWGAVLAVLVDVDNFMQYQNKFYPKSFPLLSRIGFTMHDNGSKWHRKLEFRSGFMNLVIGIILQSIIIFGGLLYLLPRLKLT